MTAADRAFTAIRAEADAFTAALDIDADTPTGDRRFQLPDRPDPVPLTELPLPAGTPPAVALTLPTF